MAKSILLNGASSSGKTSIARELEKLLPSYIYLSVDDFGENWAEQNPDRVNGLVALIDKLGKDNEEVRKQSKELSTEVISAYHSEIAENLEKGRTYILDHVLWWQSIIDDCVVKLSPYNIALVGVLCPLEKLKQRERARGDRTEGIAEMQFPHVHKGKRYDLEIDTGEMSSYECASVIVGFMKARDSAVYVPFAEKFYAVK
ncbi:MAG: chloramphenicol phosphotransferase CPT family protein [Nanoarchaeota archaeon]|nr:chloramphenicol phosphotransferase CPT family protein [Nanoarchaeota archaeon]